jgi:hypothetical protein
VYGEHLYPLPFSYLPISCLQGIAGGSESLPLVNANATGSRSGGRRCRQDPLVYGEPTLLGEPAGDELSQRRRGRRRLRQAQRSTSPAQRSPMLWFEAPNLRYPSFFTPLKQTRLHHYRHSAKPQIHSAKALPSVFFHSAKCSFTKCLKKLHSAKSRFPVVTIAMKLIY